MDIQRDIVYAIHDGHELRGDLYRPEGGSPFPAILLIHGGAMRKGDKRQWSSWGDYFANIGYAAFAVNYRLLDEDRPAEELFPKNIFDVQAAVKFLRSNRQALGLSGQVAAMGGSAGGYLTAMLALTANHPFFTYPYLDNPCAGASAQVDAAIPICGVFDAIEQWEYEQVSRPLDLSMQAYFGGTPMDHRERYFVGSPSYHADTLNATKSKWLVVWCTDDDVVPPAPQAERFVKHLKMANALTRIIPVHGAAHFWYFESEVGEPGRFNAYIGPRIRSFLTQWGGWPASPASLEAADPACAYGKH